MTVSVLDQLNLEAFEAELVVVRQALRDQRAVLRFSKDHSQLTDLPPIETTEARIKVLALTLSALHGMRNAARSAGVAAEAKAALKAMDKGQPENGVAAAADERG